MGPDTIRIQESSPQTWTRCAQTCGIAPVAGVCAQAGTKAFTIQMTELLSILTSHE